MNEAELIADFAAGLRYDDVPGDVIDHAKLHLLDTLGCGVAAWHVGAATEASEVAAEMGGASEATVIGLASRLPAPSAAFANGVLCHGLDFDDTHAASICHLGAVVCPTALAVAEATGSDGQDLVTAIVTGNEVIARLGMAAAGAFHARGFHPTSVCGVFGAAVAACRAADWDGDTTARAIGIAGSMASGTFEYLDAGTETKPLHAGWAAHAGVLASRLAARGAAGPGTILSGRFGLYSTYLGVRSDQLRTQLADLGSRWETSRAEIKLYPACHFAHGCLGATVKALRGQVISSDEIERVTVTVPQEVVPIVLEPAATKRAPQTAYEAKFSLPYSVAALLADGRVDVDSYTPEAIARPELLALADRVSYEVKEYASYPGAFPGGVVVELSDRRTLRSELTYEPGSPEAVLPMDAVRDKFRSNVAGALEPSEIDRLEGQVLAIDTHQIGDVLRPLAGAQRPSLAEGRARRFGHA